VPKAAPVDDWSASQALATLKDLKIDGKTFVIFTSDNGPWFGGNSGGPRGKKASSFEGAYRVLFFARWPGKIPAGQVSAGLVVMMDMFATALGAAEIPASADRVLDGKNIMPLLTSSVKSPHEFIFGCQQGPQLMAARDVRWKLHVIAPIDPFARLCPPGQHWIDPAGPDGVTFRAPCQQAQSSEYLGLQSGDRAKPMMLLDPQSDPGEQRDVAAQHPDVVERLKPALDKMNQKPAVTL
jgi:uncharacterized sulfatase